MRLHIHCSTACSSQGGQHTSPSGCSLKMPKGKKCEQDARWPHASHSQRDGKNCSSLFHDIQLYTLQAAAGVDGDPEVITWPKLAAAIGCMSNDSYLSSSFPPRFLSIMATASELSKAGTLSCSITSHMSNTEDRVEAQILLMKQCSL